MTIFAGGDLNIPSEGLLLKHHAGAAALPATEAERLALVDAARPKLSAHFAKACHHGSGDVSRAFLTAINPLGTIISSGDDEAFSHPRADTLGTIGKCSRGERPRFLHRAGALGAGTDQAPGVLHAELDALVASLKTKLTPAQEKKVNASNRQPQEEPRAERRRLWRNQPAHRWHPRRGGPENREAREVRRSPGTSISSTGRPAPTS